MGRRAAWPLNPQAAHSAQALTHYFSIYTAQNSLCTSAEGKSTISLWSAEVEANISEIQVTLEVIFAHGKKKNNALEKYTNRIFSLPFAVNSVSLKIFLY